MDQTRQQIKLYPLVLCRLGTLPYDLLDGIRWGENELLTVELLIYRELCKYAEKDKRDKKQKQEFLNRIKKFVANFEQKYLQQQQLHRASFYAFSGHPLLQKGLLQSSPSLWDGLQRYRLQSPAIYRKKERQTERSLAQYLARICTKTSPFSTFTALSLNDLSGKNIGPEAAPFSSVIRINNYVLAQVEELLSAYPPFYMHLAVQVNPTLKAKGEEYVFLMNSRNIESIQKIEENEVLALILSISQQYTSGQQLFGQLIKKLGEEVAASAEELEGYLSDLVRLGFLNWVWPVSGTDPNWNSTLLDWMKTLPDFEGKEWIVAALGQLETAASELPKLSADKRRGLIQESMAHLKRCFQEIADGIPERQVSEQEAFVAFQNTNLVMSPEKLFFEDTQMSAEMDWSESDLEKSVLELSQLTEMLLPFRMHTELEAPLLFFKSKYKLGEEVPLMQFYQDFYAAELRKDSKEESSSSSITNSLSLAQEQVLAKREKITQELSKHITIDSNFTVHLPLPVLNTVMAPIQQKVAVTPSPKSFGALLQLQRSSNGQYKSYVDAVFTGYGKMLGRFLHLFPKEKTTQVTNWVEQLRGNSLWVDNTDASFHNANAHPAFLQKVVSVPGGQQSPYNENDIPFSSEEQRLLLTDLSVRFSESKNKLLLYCQEEEVTIFNFGLEALQSRSPMYRLLSSFCTTQPDITPLKMMLLKASRQKKGSWTLLPRVNIGDHLVLQRRAWFIPKVDLPLREKSESEAVYFLRVNDWRMQHALPVCVFITLSPMEVGESDNDNNSRNTYGYKPQFIDFSSPALVSHLGRELKKVKTMLKIEEVLPGKGEMLAVNGRESAVELVVQWEQKSQKSSPLSNRGE
ncbi:MAG: hypothetical protein ACI8YQ_001077 [Polaribacter sp.]|jgi:hypothetical protein